MRRTISAMTLCAAAALLLTGCGSADPKPAPEGGKQQPQPAASQQQGQSPSSAPAGSGGGARHEVTLEVGGTGKTAVMYSGIGSGFEQQTLPWSKSGTAELTAAEQKVGYLVSVVPGTITGSDGKLQQAPCTIKVDGKVVAESDGVTNAKGCSYKIKH
ncbi:MULTISPECIES: hypothetical protein [Streptomyces]|uniref:Lipoprotein n=1 Tax=Streptomyces amritsarensis TaxID=681158 RepID=A0ABX3GCH8_9ACTN|nr:MULTISPECIES: hypothetical protein [Streptomyces]AQT72027.1 hypothetical protein B1K54_10380 [Streptomyces sp. fd1-xmd]MDX6763744.1 hypothetical protein [Streptomyces sp. F8]OLZ72493.1 hypothetical protein AVW11_03605 [Streptomyces amritsarensis]